ncbi:hypothetical protein PV11_01895 [Exophiala sideris]|uniref:Uncharacterized protein n=1 Tax=Exophiala sideris TaxID=1016849 RepID=A0A0D1YUK2_9EURO|nr:hypothetical protein PV11_01895 [Exophiala sideris]
MPPIRGHGRNQRDGRVRKQHRRLHGAQNSMSATINFSVEIPSARGEDWRVYSSDEKDDSVHDTEQLPDRSLSTTDPKSESTDNTPSQKATHPNQARPDPNGLTSTHAQDDVPHRKRKVEVDQTETLVDRKSHHSVRSRSSLTIQLAKAAKSDSNASWKVKKRLELSKAWPSLTDAEQEERKEAAIEDLMRRRLVRPRNTVSSSVPAKWFAQVH